MRQRTCSLVSADSDYRNEITPFVDFGADALAELFRRGGLNLESLGVKSSYDVGHHKNLRHFTIKTAYDRERRSGRRDYRDPKRRFVTGKATFLDRRDIWQ